MRGFAVGSVVLLLILVGGAFQLQSVICAAADHEKPAWVVEKTFEFDQLVVSISRPVLVSRDKDRVWFPTLVRLPGDGLLAVVSAGADSEQRLPKAQFRSSENGGLTWSDPQIGVMSGSDLRLPNDDTLLLPTNLITRPDGTLTHSYQWLTRDGRQPKQSAPEALRVVGLPRRPRMADLDKGEYSFGFTGPIVTLKDGSYLSTLYGLYAGEGDVDPRHSSHLIAATSKNGTEWRYLSTIATPAIIPRGSGGEGPSEAALCRLSDGRLMCVFRISSGLPFGQTWSADEGQTWVDPTIMENSIRSVQPSLVVLPGGAVLLSGGRPGVNVWINERGDGKVWSRMNVSDVHNACNPREPHVSADSDATKHSTSGYTEIVLLKDGQALLVYDYLRGGWDNLPKDPSQTNSVWVVRLAVKAKQ